MSRRFPIYKQLDAMDCGATCLRMIARYYGRFYSLEHLREITYVDREGVSMLGISDAAEQLGFQTLGVVISYDRLADDIPLPCIAYWEQRHFVVIHKVNKRKITIADPAIGMRTMSRADFEEGWAMGQEDNEKVGVALLLETTPDFFVKEGDKINKGGFSYIFSYLKKYKLLILQLVLGLLIGSVLQVLFPFLMQALVDVGIENQNINFIYLILIAHLILYVSQTVVEFIRSWILLHIGTRINISLVSDFLFKLTKLPIRFFETKLTGDFMQRIYDNQRIEQFLTSASLFTLFNFVNLIIFGFVLAYYNLTIFGIYLLATALYGLWIVFFLRRRRDLDYQRYDVAADSQNTLIELIHGMKEIKLHNDERNRRWAWERIQARMFRTNISLLAVDQWQRAGTKFINETKNILITFIAAKAVIDGDMTLGMLVAIQYIIGQLNMPIEDLVYFIHTAQDAKLSLERMNEIHEKKDEEGPLNEQGKVPKITILPENGSLNVESVSFQYGGPHSPIVLQDVTIHIPKGKMTAIVGASGSGKTTLLKLLLNFYPPTKGFVRLNDINLNNIQNRMWRDKVGAVLQGGYIFSDSIAKNIAMGDTQHLDKDRLLQAVKIAHIQDFIESLPLGYNTVIGEDGIPLSQGQIQRILIARAIYKNPDYFFFDEATNALDVGTERIVMRNLEQHFKEKTVISVAHRLSTVQNANNIIVLDQGQVVEQGTHQELVDKRGFYYQLVSNQLELVI